MTGAELIAAERERQIAEEGWTPEHDDGHNEGELALAACCYAAPVLLYRMYVSGPSHATVRFTDPWPWSNGYDKRKNGGNVPRVPEDRLPFLVKAGALIAAEIDRLQRESLVPERYHRSLAEGERLYSERDTFQKLLDAAEKRAQQRPHIPWRFALEQLGIDEGMRIRKPDFSYDWPPDLPVPPQTEDI